MFQDIPIDLGRKGAPDGEYSALSKSKSMLVTDDEMKHCTVVNGASHFLQPFSSIPCEIIYSNERLVRDNVAMRKDFSQIFVRDDVVMRKDFSLISVRDDVTNQKLLIAIRSLTKER